MRMPNVKKVSKLSSKLLYEAIQRYIKLVYDGRVYAKAGSCPGCGLKNISRHDSRGRVFCKLITADGFEDVVVYVVRFKCNDCCKRFKAEDEPFYKDCLYGKPIVDLCLTLLAFNPYNRVEVELMNFGIQVDRDTVKNYSIKFNIKARKIAGIGMFGVNVGVNILKLLFGVENVEQLREEYPEEVYDGVADETYPPIRGAKKKMKQENRIRKWKKEKTLRHPDGFCVASSYLPHLQLFVSLLWSVCDFNWLLARILLSPLLGIDYLCTDGEPSYQDSNPEPCLIHKFRNLIKSDDLKELKNEIHPDEFSELLRFLYGIFEEKMLEMLKAKYPHLVENDMFKGSLSTNTMEGGNWRIKWNLRTSYSNLDGMSGRVLLITLMDSMYVFRNGRPIESFAHQYSDFNHGMVMNEFPLGSTNLAFSEEPMIECMSS